MIRHLPSERAPARSVGNVGAGNVELPARVEVGNAFIARVAAIETSISVLQGELVRLRRRIEVGEASAAASRKSELNGLAGRVAALVVSK